MINEIYVNTHDDTEVFVTIQRHFVLEGAWFWSAEFYDANGKQVKSDTGVALVDTAEFARRDFVRLYPTAVRVEKSDGRRERKSDPLIAGWNATQDVAAKQTPDGWRVALHADVQQALGWLTPGEIEEVVDYAIREALEDSVVKPPVSA